MHLRSAPDGPKIFGGQPIGTVDIQSKPTRLIQEFDPRLLLGAAETHHQIVPSKWFLLLLSYCFNQISSTFIQIGLTASKESPVIPSINQHHLLWSLAFAKTPGKQRSLPCELRRWWNMVKCFQKHLHSCVQLLSPVYIPDSGCFRRGFLGNWFRFCRFWIPQEVKDLLIQAWKHRSVNCWAHTPLYWPNPFSQTPSEAPKLFECLVGHNIHLKVHRIFNGLATNVNELHVMPVVFCVALSMFPGTPNDGRLHSFAGRQVSPQTAEWQIVSPSLG